MKKLVLAVLLLFLASCAQIIPTPNEFPTPPMTVIVEFPQTTAEPRFVPLPQPITSADMVEAGSFLLILQTNAAVGNSEGIAERVFYPIDVRVNGQSAKIESSDEFVQNYDQIFNDEILQALTEAETDDLTSGAEGVRVGNGELWFNLFCMDAACAQKEFLITQINN